MFWQYQGLTDFLYIVLGVGLVLLLPLLGLFSTFAHFLFREKTSSCRAEDFALLLGRFISPKLFSFLVFLLNAVLGATLCFFILLRYGYLSWEMTPVEGLAFSVFIAFFILLIILWRRLNFRIWSNLFMSEEEKHLLFRDHALIAYFRSLSILVLFFLALTPIDKSVILYLFLFGLVFFALMRAFFTLRVLSARIENWFSVFLYLCSCELLPWAYILLALVRIYKYNYLVSLFEYL